MSTNDLYSEDLNIGLFVDIENLVISASNIGLPVNLKPVIDKLVQYGRISVRKAYGDLDKACRSDRGLRKSIRIMFQDNFVIFEDIAYTKQKNMADVRLTVDVLSTAFTNPELNCFAIISGDRDFIPLVSKLKELNKRVIGIGPSKDTVNDSIIPYFDEFLYYSALIMKDSDGENITDDVDYSDMREEYIELLVRAIKDFGLRGQSPLGSTLGVHMRRLMPDFSLELARLKSFGDLVRLAESRGVVKIDESGPDIRITLTDRGSTEKAKSKSKFPASVEEQKGKYLEFFESKLKCDLPAASLRTEIYRATESVLGELDEDIALSKLSVMVADRVSGVTQPAIFKILYSLFRNQLFIAVSGDKPYNPIIRGIEGHRRPEEWDRLFIVNSLSVMQKERGGWPKEAPSLAAVFEVPADRMAEMIEESAAE